MDFPKPDPQTHPTDQRPPDVPASQVPAPTPEPFPSAKVDVGPRRPPPQVGWARCVECDRLRPMERRSWMLEREPAGNQGGPVAYLKSLDPEPFGDWTLTAIEAWRFGRREEAAARLVRVAVPPHTLVRVVVHEWSGTGYPMSACPWCGATGWQDCASELAEVGRGARRDVPIWEEPEAPKTIPCGWRGIIIVDLATMPSDAVEGLKAAYPEAVVVLGRLPEGGVRWVIPGKPLGGPPPGFDRFREASEAANRLSAKRAAAPTTRPITRAHLLPPGQHTLCQDYARDLCRLHKGEHVRPQTFDAVRNTAAGFLESVLFLCPVSPERSTAIAKAREALMWAIASLVVVDEPREKPAPPQAPEDVDRDSSCGE